MGRGRPEPTKPDKQGRYKSDSKKCFIATSVYGDIDAPEVHHIKAMKRRCFVSNTFGEDGY